MTITAATGEDMRISPLGQPKPPAVTIAPAASAQPRADAACVAVVGERGRVRWGRGVGPFGPAVVAVGSGIRVVPRRPHV